jgi:phenylacetate-CoA ligase
MKGPVSQFGIAKNRVPVSAKSYVQWSTAIELVFSSHEKPTFAAALALKITLAHGYAGVGWHDMDGLAEEIHVGPGPCTRIVYLTVWNPETCQKIIVRSYRREPLSVTLESADWFPFREVLKSHHWRSSLDGLPSDCFLEAPFSGYLSEALWRDGAKGRPCNPKLRLRRLQLLVSLAWQYCPGYRAWWSHHGWHPSHLRSLADADAIPVITKEQIRSNLQAFSLPRRNTMLASTSGSTGQPFSFQYTKALNFAHHAQVALACSFGAPGLLPVRTRLAVLSGRAVRGLSLTGPAGGLVLTHAVLREPELLLDLIQSYQPTALFTLPSSAAKLAEALSGKYRFRVVVVGSENILPAQIRAAEQIADKVIATYGLSEGAAFALRCPSCGTYGELSRHCLTRLRHRSDGLFEIIGTGFWSLGTLFIAYATGDLTAGPTEACADCSIGEFHFARVLGREQDVLVDCNGTPYTIALVYGALSDVMPQIKLYDFLQAAPGRVTMRYVTHDGYPLDHNQLERALRHVIPTLAITLQMTPELISTDSEGPRTKWKFVKTGQLTHESQI